MIPAEGYCPIHPEETFKYFCDSVDCFRQYCKNCFINHRWNTDHKMIRVERYDGEHVKSKHWEMFRQLQTLIQDSHELIKVLNASLKEANEREKIFPIECKRSQKYYPKEYIAHLARMKCTAGDVREFITSLIDTLKTNSDFMKKICKKTIKFSRDENNNDAIEENMDEIMLEYKQILIDFATASEVVQKAKQKIGEEACTGKELKIDPLITYPLEAQNKRNDAYKELMKPKDAILLMKIGDPTAIDGKYLSASDFCIVDRDEFLIADRLNHRIQRYDKNGILMFQFGQMGKEIGNLYYPQKVASFPTTENVVVGDVIEEKSRLQIFTKYGNFVRIIDLADVQCITCLIVLSQYEEIAVIDATKAILCTYSKLGVMTRIFKCLDYIREPTAMTFFQDNLYICDKISHRIVVINLDGEVQKIIGNIETSTYPNGIDIDPLGQIMVGCTWKNKIYITIFNNQGAFICKLQCLTMDNQICSGLKLNSDGRLITMSKNNIFVLDTQFITNEMYFV